MLKIQLSQEKASLQSSSQLSASYCRRDHIGKRTCSKFGGDAIFFGSPLSVLRRPRNFRWRILAIWVRNFGNLGLCPVFPSFTATLFVWCFFFQNFTACCSFSSTFSSLVPLLCYQIFGILAKNLAYVQGFCRVSYRVLFLRLPPSFLGFHLIS